MRGHRTEDTPRTEGSCDDVGLGCRILLEDKAHEQNLQEHWTCILGFLQELFEKVHVLSQLFGFQCKELSCWSF